MTWNIHHAEGVDGKLDIARVAAVINAAKPDLVAVQEVDQRTKRVGGMDQPAELSKLTGLHAAFGKAIDYQGGEYGQVILSRWPLPPDDVEVLKLPGAAEKEQRIAVAARLQLGDGGPALRFITTHFDHTRGSPDRPLQAARVNELFGQGDELTILAGDLNDVPDGEVMKLLRPQWVDAGHYSGPTIPAADPARRIDYVLVRPASRWRVIEARAIEEPVASDHRPVLVVLELISEAEAADRAAVSELLLKHMGLDLNPADRAATLNLIMQNDCGPERPDLNGDGQVEYIGASGYYVEDGQLQFYAGGTGNCRAWVFAKLDGVWQEIGDVRGKRWEVLPNRTNGWLDIRSYWDSGLVNDPTVHRFNGRRY